MATRVHDALCRLDYLTRRASLRIDELVVATAPARATAPRTAGVGAAGTTVADAVAGSERRSASFGSRQSTAATAELAVLRVELARERAATKAALTSLRSKEAALEELTHAAAATQVSVVKLKQQLDEKESALLQLGGRFQQVQESSAASSVAQDELEARLRASTREKSELRARLKAADGQTAQVEARVAELTSALKEAKDAHRAAVLEVEARDAQIASLQADVQSGKKALARMRKEQVAASGAASAQQARALADLARKKDAELSSLNAKLKVADKIAETTKASRSAVSAKLAEARKEVAELKQAMDSKAAEAAKMTKDMDDLHAKLERLEAANTLVTDELRAVRAREEDESTARLESDTLNEELRQEKEGLEGRLRALEMQVETLRDSTKEAEDEAAASKQLVSGLNRDKRLLAKHVAKQQDTLKKVVKEYKSCKKAHEKALRELRDTSAQLLDTGERLAEAETHRRELEVEAEERVGERQAVGQQLRMLRAELQRVSGERRAAVTAARTLDCQLMAAEDRLAWRIEEAAREEEFRIRTGGWVRRQVTSKPPPLTLADPVITGVLTSWTTDQRKIAYVQKWMNDIAKGKQLDNKKLHRGLELCKLTAEVRDGFLMLIIPLLQQRPDIQVKVVTREHVEVRTDMRIKVLNAPAERFGDSSSVTSGGSADTNATFRTRDFDRFDAASVHTRRSSVRSVGISPSGSDSRRHSALVAGSSARTPTNRGDRSMSAAPPRSFRGGSTRSGARGSGSSSAGGSVGAAAGAGGGAGAGARAGSSSAQRVPVGPSSNSSTSSTSSRRSRAARMLYGSGPDPAPIEPIDETGPAAAAPATLMATTSPRGSRSSSRRLSGTSRAPTRAPARRAQSERLSRSSRGSGPQQRPSRSNVASTSNGTPTAAAAPPRKRKSIIGSIFSRG